MAGGDGRSRRLDDGAVMKKEWRTLYDRPLSNIMWRNVTLERVAIPQSYLRLHDRTKIRGITHFYGTYRKLYPYYVCKRDSDFR